MQVAVRFKQEDLVGVCESVEILEFGGIRGCWFFNDDVLFRSLPCFCAGGGSGGSAEKLPGLLVVQRVWRGDVDGVD